MSEIYKTHEGGLYFVSFSVVGWLDIFTRLIYQDILVESIIYCQKNKGLLLYAYCIMPNHVHFVAAANTGRLSSILRDLKSFTAKQLIKAIEENPQESRKGLLMNQFEWYGKISPQKQHYQFWQHDNHTFDLFSNKLINQKIDYIHQNPVAAGFVDEDWKWRLSSANPASPITVIES